MDPQELPATLTDGLAIHCLAEKYGLTLSIWKKNPNTSAWDRHTFAPKFSTDGIAGLRQKKSHCHLCSKDDTIQHYILLRVSECLNRGPWRQELIWLFHTCRKTHPIKILSSTASQFTSGRSPLNSPGTLSSMQTYVESDQASSSYSRPFVTPKAKTTADSEEASCHGVHTYRSISTKPENNENVMLERNPLKAQLVDQRLDTCSRTIGLPLQLSRSLVKKKPGPFNKSQHAWITSSGQS